MGTIRITGNKIDHTLPANPAVSLLNTLLAEGIVLPHHCGGRAMCGQCRIRIVSGERKLSPVRPRERERLDALGLPPDYRLACQTHAAGDIVISIPE